MPTISRFYGLLIRMYHDDYNPPHFHVLYGEYHAVIGIRDYRILEGNLPPRAFGLAAEWARIHQRELLQEWQQARKGQQFLPIDPLE